MPHGPIPDKPEPEFDPETGYWLAEPIPLPKTALRVELPDPAPEAGQPGPDFFAHPVSAG
jgi:hypothetical protein